MCQKPFANTGPIAEIATLAVKILHRSKGLGTALLRTALKSILDSDIKKVRLCVQVGEEDLMRFYERAGGFKTTGVTISGYYRRLEPSDAVVMEADLKKVV